MNRRVTYVLAGSAAVVVVVLGAAGIAAASSTGEGPERDTPISGPELERASTAALTHTGGGRVTETEVGDEESYYEVEVTRPDGSQVDVQLDNSFTVVGSSPDTETDPGR